MNLPVRKCYYTVKIGIFLVIVLTLLSCFERWRGGRRTVRAQYLNPEEEEYERQILEDEARIIPGLGEGGVAAHLVGEAKKLGEESEKELAINVYLSDRIAYNRTLKDYRNPACQRVLYDAELPSASVILIFHNEPYSVVVRTIWSVINSARRDQPWYSRANYVERDTGRIMTLGYPGQDPTSKFVYLKEIILVDDNSTLPELKGKLSHYIRTRLPPDLVRVIRLPDRVGLTQARQAGSRHATADVMVFLDSHCEVMVDWLRPLLQRIKEKRTAVLTPIIDMLQQTTFEYYTGNLMDFEVGGFLFTGHFTWVDVPERERKRRGSDIAPTWSPTMAGGLFAMDRAYFWQLGAYDEQMAGWGGENLEMSFRVWQCGGTLETIPCSRVGHVFRSFHPYGLPAHTDTHGINTARMAEVWMDDYAELFYLHRPDLRNNPSVGDVTHRRVLRDKLRCKSFQWYLDTVYREKFVPVRDVLGYGRIKNAATGLCLDTMQREGEASPLGLYPCHARLQATQYLALSAAGQLRDEERCAELHYQRRKPDEDEARQVLMISCRGQQRGQRWRYLPSKQLQHVESGLCLTARREAGSDATARRCARTDLQRWDIDYSLDNDFGLANNVELSDQELRLQRLRGRKRTSRSLLAAHKGRRRAHRKRRKQRKKNKFILKLVRRRDNGTEEHVEADIYCAHSRLFPNNSFVRDLVAILNERDVKVINNGRVFEKNRVTELVKKHDAVKAVKVLEKMELPREAPVDKAEPKHWPAKKREPEPEPVPPYDPLGPSGAPRPVNAGAELAGNELEKRIVVEDFVEIQPAATAAPRKKSQHKHKRGRGRAPPTVKNTPRVAPRTHDQVRQWERPQPADSPASAEDGPLLTGSAEGRKRGRPEASAEDYRLESRAHRNEATAPPYSHGRDHDAPVTADSSVDQETYSDDTASRPNPPPVQLVMRSNLTFKLGDEFFNWRHSPDDVANLLGELTIPANAGGARSDNKRGEEPERGSDVTRTRDSAEDAVLTGRGVPHRDNTAANDVDDSGSSESASSDK